MLLIYRDVASFRSQKLAGLVAGPVRSELLAGREKGIDNG